jgi:hypothetical protein
VTLLAIPHAKDFTRYLSRKGAKNAKAQREEGRGKEVIVSQIYSK